MNILNSKCEFQKVLSNMKYGIQDLINKSVLIRHLMAVNVSCALNF